MSAAAAAPVTGAGALLRLRTPEIAITLFILVVLGSLLLPLPPLVLDVLLALSFMLSILVLLAVIYTTNPLDFNSFPVVLLVLTLFRLGLNVSTTRLILGDGYAGEVVEAFGTFVVRGNLVVGLVVTLILSVVNFIVITKGAGRVAEVAARFTLDAMPGRQMAIDADLQAGLIDEKQARERREEISRQADFYGASDGAAKFVRGDAVAALLITFINLVGGLLIGVFQRDMSIADAAHTYSMLSIGDALVSQIPALIVSVAAGILVTQASGDTHMGEAIFSQITRHTRALWISSAVMGVFAFVPGMPTLPFLFLAACVGGVAWATGGAAAAAASGPAQMPLPDAAQRAESSAEPGISDILHIQPLTLQVGLSLIPMIDRKSGGDLVARITAMRKAAAVEMGLVVPPITVQDNRGLGPNEYVIKLRGVDVANGEIFPLCLFALDTGDVIDKVTGIKDAIDPSFGLPAVWIRPESKAEAEAAGYSVVEPPVVVATHLLETIKAHADELLSRHETSELIEGLRKSHPALVKDTVPEKISLGVLQRVLQRLLREGVPIRDMVTILETLSDAADKKIGDPDALAEEARRGLARVITHQHQDDDGAIRGIFIGTRLEVALMNVASGKPGAIDPNVLRLAVDSLVSMANRLRQDGRYPPLVCAPTLRVAVRRLIESTLPALPVLSFSELTPQAPLHAVGTWDLPGN